MDRKFLVIKITGGIGAGKSHMGEILKSRGEIVIDADVVAKKFKQTNYLNSATIFGDSTLLRQIENKTHPLIVADITKQIEDYKAEGSTRVFVLVPALRHFAADIACDITIALTADEQIRIRRVIATRRMTEDEVKLRIKNQVTDDEIARDADKVISNEGTKKDFEDKIEDCLASLK